PRRGRTTRPTPKSRRRVRGVGASGPRSRDAHPARGRSACSTTPPPATAPPAPADPRAHPAHPAREAPQRLARSRARQVAPAEAHPPARGEQDERGSLTEATDRCSGWLASVAPPTV